MPVVTAHERPFDLTPGDPATSTSPPIARVDLLAVFCCGTFAFIDLYCTQPLLPLLAGTLHVTEAAANVTVSASTLGVAISAALLALFGERLDRKRTIVAAMLLLATVTLLTATSTGLHALAFWRFLQGLVTPGVFIPAIAYITEEWPGHQVPRVVSVYVAGTVFGGFSGRVVGGVIGGDLGWRLVFLVLGLAGFGGVLVVRRLLKPSRTPRPVLSPGTRSSPLAPILANLRNRRLLATFGVGFCMLFTLVSVFSYITFLLSAPPFRLTTAELSWLFSVYILGLIATLATGNALVRIGLRLGMIAAATLCLSGVLLTLAPSLVVIAIGLSATSSGIFIAQTCCNSFLRDAAAPGHRVSAAGMYICSYYIGGTAGGLLPSLAWHRFGWPGVVALTGSFLVLAALLPFFFWRAPRPEPVPL